MTEAVPAFRVLRRDLTGPNGVAASEFISEHDANMLALELSLTRKNATYGVARMCIDRKYKNGWALVFERGAP